ncbi:hypothetical protein COCCU_03975 [Corynebacterium occultum]|uniref:Beta-lactamase n=1 Tax=Corynebacterium occultum TaxID=2675219 RepID=A0A6B8VRJ7_9CORY|nr:hypothetical protein [Corynebacterium occultum]QGU06743.1 hypothetical protein COCCU_03975 [Corynebacterium occultum]
MRKILAALLVMTAPLGACAIPEGEQSAQLTETVTLTSTSAPTPSPDLSPTTAPADPTPGERPIPGDVELQPLIDAALASFGGSAGIAVSDGSSELTAGDDAALPAWSTIKVPLTIAALRQDPGALQWATPAIQNSDNDAATALWNSLGDPATAGAAIAQVLGEGGNQVVVNTEVIRSGFSSFGQTAWSPSQQARFAAQLPCVTGGQQLLGLMAGIAPSQAQGLGTLPGARFKGGWGPDLQGTYDLRQFGLFSGGQGDVAVAISTHPASGTYEDAQAMATQIAAGLAPMLADLPAATCG